MPKEFKRMSKKSRRNLKLWAEGSREDVLKPHIAGYADALEHGWVAERAYLDAVCDEYHAKISWRLDDHDEPPLPLPQYDPAVGTASDEDLTDEEVQAKRARLKVLNARIRRWLKYRARALRRRLSPTMDPKKNPYALLLAELSGFRPPTKALQGYQQLMKESYDEVIRPVVQQQWAKKVRDENLAADVKCKAPFRAAVARQLFKALPQHEQDRLKSTAQADAKAAKAAYEKAIKEAPSLDPEDRQRCIDGIAPFLAPILQGIEKRTKLNAVVILGGCIPKYGGEIGTYHVANGRNLGKSPVYFPQWQKDRFDKEVLGFYREYLATAYTERDKREASLPEGQSLDDAPYKIGPGGSGNSSESEQESGSDSETDCSSESDSDASSESDSSSRAQTRGSSKTKKAKKALAKKAKGRGKRGAAEVDERQPKRRKVAGSALSPSEGETSSAALTQPAPSLPYTPYSETDPSGPLIPPDPSNYSQTKAYNIAVNKRLLEEAVKGLGPPPDELSATPQARPRPRPRARSTKASKPQPARRSGRLNASDMPAAGAAGHGLEAPGDAAEPGGQCDAVSHGEANGAVPSAVSGAGNNDASLHTGKNAAAEPTGAAAGQSEVVMGTAGENVAAAPTDVGEGQSGAATGPSGNGTTAPTDVGEQQNDAATEPNGDGTINPALLMVHDLSVGDTSSTARGSNVGGTGAERQGGAGAAGVAQTGAGSAAAAAGTEADDLVDGEPGAPGTEEPGAPAVKPTERRALAAAASPAAHTLPMQPEEVPTCPADAAAWMQDGYAQVSKTNLGPLFCALLRLWIRLEEAYGYERGSGALPKAGRPEELSKWIAAGRGRSKPPTIPRKRVKAYAEVWWVWWGSMQPGWRLRSAHGRPLIGNSYGSDWGKLRVPGQNGLLSAIAALYWWGCALSECHARERGDWEVAVQDISWAVKGLLQSMD